MKPTTQKELAQDPEKHQAKLQAFQAGDEGHREGGRQGVVRKPSGTETILFWFLLVNGILHRSETSYKTQAPTVHKAQENVRKGRGE